MLRITAYALCWFSSHECYRIADGGIIEPTELDEAERHLQYLVQGESFHAERKDLLENKPVKWSSRIAPFSPFIGPNRLMRSAGRIKRLVEVDFDVKHLIVLDAHHAFVKLFLRHNHVKHHHQGIDYLRAEVQERYTVLKLRSSLRCIKSNCVTCRKFRTATIQPIMADLPVERLAYQSPSFTNTGVDYFGPFYVTIGRTTFRGFPLYMLNYSCRSCWNRSVHGRQFLCNGSGAVRLPLEHTCHHLVGQWHKLCWRGKRTMREYREVEHHEHRRRTCPQRH